MFVLVDNQDSFRELGGNEALLRCLENCEKLQKDAILKAIAKAVDENSNRTKQSNNFQHFDVFEEQRTTQTSSEKMELLSVWQAF